MFTLELETAQTETTSSLVFSHFLISVSECFAKKKKKTRFFASLVMFFEKLSSWPVFEIQFFELCIFVELWSFFANA